MRVGRRAAVPALLAGLAVALAGAVLADTAASASTGTAARADSGSPAEASAQKRCRSVRVKLKRNGKVVKRNGKPVLRRVRRCTKVPSPGCRFVKIKKRTKSGKVIKRNGKTVYIKLERCPPKPSQPGAAPGPQPGPAPGPQPGPAPGPQPGPAPPSDLANRALALPQHVPDNINLFTSVFFNGQEGYYPAGSAMAPEDLPVPTEEQARTELTTFLEQRFGAGAAAVNEALALYDSDAVEALIAEPLLRAVFAGMKGTALEPAINHLLTSGRFSEVRLGGTFVGVIAASIPVAATGKNLIIFSRVYDGERLEYLIPIMGHEILHDDNLVVGSEEAINGALTSMTYMQLVSQFPELAHRDTELARSMNDFARTFINSREAQSPNSEIYAPTGLGTAPGSPSNVTDLWTDRNTFGKLPGTHPGGSAPAPEPLRTILQNIFAPGTPIPATLNFDQATAELFENLNDNWLSDTQRAQVSVLLQLVTVDEIAQATGLGQQQIIDTLGLQPYLDAIGS